MAETIDKINPWRGSIDKAVQQRDFARLAEMIFNTTMPQAAREYLAKIILDLLAGRIRAAKHRPKNWQTEWKNQQLAQRAVSLQRYHHEWKKLTAVVEKIHQETGRAKSAIWKAIKKYRGYAEHRLEEAEYDAILDAAYEAEWESAVHSLIEEFGERDFTDEEVRDQIEADRSVDPDF